MPATPEQVRAGFTAYLRAWTTNDRALMLSLFAEDCVFEDPVGTPPFRGQAGIARFWDYSHADPDVRLVPRMEEIRACADQGIMRFTMAVRQPARNRGIDLSLIEHVELDDAGLIRRVRVFWDASSVSVPEGMEPYTGTLEAAYEP